MAGESYLGQSYGKNKKNNDYYDLGGYEDEYDLNRSESGLNKYESILTPAPQQAPVNQRGASISSMPSGESLAASGASGAAAGAPAGPQAAAVGAAVNMAGSFLTHYMAAREAEKQQKRAIRQKNQEIANQNQQNALQSTSNAWAKILT